MTCTKGCWKKNANEKKSGAGQYFTPRPLIDSMVAVMQPTLDDIIQDPAAGTGGFLIAANRYLREHSDPDCAGPRRSNASIGATPSTVWSTCRTHTGWR